MTKWIKSSRCESAYCLEVCEGGACVELTTGADGSIRLRGTGPLSTPETVVTVTREEFRIFLEGAKAGDFDHLAQEDAVAQDGQF